MKKWIAGTIIQYWNMIAALLVIQMGGAVLVSLQPLYYQRIVSLAVGGMKSGLLTEGLFLVAVLAAIYLGGMVLHGLGGFVACIFSSNLLKRLQVDFFEKISQLPLQFFQRKSSGEFFTKFNNDVGQAQNFIANILPSAMREFVTAITVVVILFWFCSAALTCAALGIVVITSLMVVQLNRTMSRYANAQRDGWSEINKIFDETVQGIDTLKTFATEKQRSAHFQKHTTSFRNLSVRAGVVTAVFSPSTEFISKFGSLLLVLLAYYMISKGSIRLDSFLLFFFYAGLLEGAVSSLVGLVSNVQPQLVGIRNLSAFFSESSEEDESHKISARLDKPIPIEISGLSFSYPGGRTLFSNANLLVPAKSITVIHGPSGSGKSTLINLLLRFYVPQNGSIRFGNVNIEHFTRTELRQKISVVTQYHFIFNDSLRMNLLVAKPDATDVEMVRALERAHLGEFLRRLPNGLDEVMDPRGKGISEGEKQRISIARLLLRDSPIMVLDEPWSNLDEEAREVLAEVINARKSTTTIVILTHTDLPSLAVDQVYELVTERKDFIRSK